MNIILRKVLETWNPLSDEKNLELLNGAILKRPVTSEIFSMELICLCMTSSGVHDENFRAREIIGSMIERRIPDATAGFVDEEMRRGTMKNLREGIEKLIMRIPPIKMNFEIKHRENESPRPHDLIVEIHNISDQMKVGVESGSSSLSILLTMSRLWSLLKESFTLDRPSIFFDDRTKTIIWFLDETSSRSFLNVFSDQSDQTRFIDEPLSLNQPASDVATHHALNFV